MQKPSRRTLAASFSEGARQLWLALEARGWTQAEGARQLVMPTGQLSKLLYGERKPGRLWAEKILAELHIATALWDREPLVEYLPPAARPVPARPVPARPVGAKRKPAAKPRAPRAAKRRPASVRPAAA